MAREYEGIAKALASRGRYGDSMLMHVNPAEVEYLDSRTPGGLPRNPDTGQPEAFPPLAFLAAPLAGTALAAPTMGALPAAITAAMPAFVAPTLGAAVGTTAGAAGAAGAAGGAAGAGLGGLAAQLAGQSVASTIAANAPGLAAAAGGNALSASAVPTTIGGMINSGMQSVLSTVGETIMNTIATPYKLAGGALESAGLVPAGSWSGEAGALAASGTGGGVGESAALGADAATLPASATTPMSMQQGLGALGGQTQAGQALLANQGLIQSVPQSLVPAAELVTPAAQGAADAATTASSTVPAETVPFDVMAEVGSELPATEQVASASEGLGVEFPDFGARVSDLAGPEAMQAADAPGFVEGLSEIPGEIGEFVGELPGEALEYLKEAPGKALDWVKENPLEAGIMGFTVGSGIADASGGGGDDEDEIEYDPDARLDSEWSSGDIQSYDPGSVGEMTDRLVSNTDMGTRDPLVSGIADVPDTGQYDYETLGGAEDYGLAQLSAFDPSGQGVDSPSASVAQVSPDEYPRLQSEFAQMNPDGTVEEFERWLLERGYGGIA
mgnify:CR=1 FL=1